VRQTPLGIALAPMFGSSRSTSSTEPNRDAQLSGKPAAIVSHRGLQMHRDLSGMGSRKIPFLGN